MVSETANNVIGGLGGAVLAACLAPQLIKLAVTKSARDLSYIFLCLYNVGLVLTLVYLYYSDALVGWICIVVELTFGVAMVFAKAYLDNFGPHSTRGRARANPHLELCSSRRFALDIDAGYDVAAFLPGAGGMPALLALPEPSPGHQATHLLLDARLRLGNGCGSGAKLLGATAAATAQANGAATGFAEKPLRAGLGQPRAGGQQQPWPSSSGAVLLEVAELLESSLVGAGLPPRPGAHRTQSFPSFSAGCLRLAGASTAAAAGASGMAACSHKYQEIRGGLELTANGAAAVNAAEAAEAAEVGNPHMLYLEVEDGFATLIWLASTCTLALDLVTASPAATAAAAAAARSFCGSLALRYPGSRVALSSLARLPVL